MKGSVTSCWLLIYNIPEDTPKAKHSFDPWKIKEFSEIATSIQLNFSIEGSPIENLMISNFPLEKLSH